MAVLDASVYGGYSDPLMLGTEGWMTANPVARAGREASPGNERLDLAIGTEARLKARLQALAAIAAELDPNDFIGKSLIMAEQRAIQDRLSRMDEAIGESIGRANERMFSAQAQAAELQERAEIGSMYRSQIGGDYVDTGVVGGQFFGGTTGKSSLYGTPTAGQYGTVVPNTSYMTGNVGGDSTGSRQTTSPTQQGWMSDLLTSSGIRPLVGNYALDPNQQQQVALWQTYQDYGKPKTIEDWLKIKPNAELVAEQWRQMSEKVKPRRQTNTTGWIAAAAR